MSSGPLWRVRDVLGLMAMVVVIIALHFVGAWLHYEGVSP